MNSSWLAVGLVAALAASANAQELRRGEDGVLFVVTFSGGGTRAAAFGYGVVEALRATHAGERSLLERIDRVAGVSGGSFLAAQLALDDGPKALERFQAEMLFTNLETQLVKSAASNSLKLMRGDYNRSDAAAECYGKIFGGATLGDLPSGGPELWIQVTDLLGGCPLALRPEALRHMGMGPRQLTLGQAVAASAAVPGALPPLNLEIPGHTPASCPEGGCGQVAGQKTAVPLADGGIADNLGLEVLFQGSLPPETRAVVVVVVNSRRALSTPWKLDGSGLISAGYTVALQQRLLDRLVLQRARERLQVLELRANLSQRELRTELVVIDFNGSKRKAELDEVGTRFDLEKEQVGLLITEGRAEGLKKLGPLAGLWGATQGD